MIRLHKVLFAASVAASAALFAVPVVQAAEAYPSKPIRLVVPFPPGGGTDTMARYLGKALTDEFGWNIVVENRPGAGGTVGLGIAARAQADGYNMVLGQTSNLSINPYLYKEITYDVAKDFAPVASVASQPMVLVVNADRPFTTLAEMVEYAKANPGKLTIGNAGTGTVGDITGRFFASEAGIETLNVPYKGAAPAMNDLLGGQVDAFFASAPAALPQLNNPKVRLLAITTLESIPQFPGVPALAETVPGFEAASRTGILTPAGVPQDIIDSLNKHINKALQNESLRKSVEQEGNVVLGGGVQDFTNMIAQDSAKWSKIIKDNDLRIN